MKRKAVLYAMVLALLFVSAAYNYTKCPRPDFPSCLQYSFGGWVVGP